jgi:membrane protease YdiL (CAAX protease family)
MDRKTLLSVTVIVEGGLFLLALFLISAAGMDPRPRFEPSIGATFLALLLCLPMLAALYITSRTDWPPLARLRREMDEKVRPIFANCKPIDLLIISLFAGVAEELFFRGWLQTVLVARFGLLSGIILASLLFGLAHYLSKEYALYALITGLYLGIIFHWTGNLYLLMLIHALYDFIALLALKKEKGETD